MPRSTYTEKVDYYWAPTLTDPAAPTSSEMAAATELTCEIAEYPDLSVSTSNVEAPSLCDRFTAKYPDVETVDDATIVFYYDDTQGSDSETIRALLTRDTSGYLVRVDAVDGIVPSVTTQGTVVDVWPVTIASNFKNQPAVGEMRKFTVGITVTAPPEEDVQVV